MRFCEEKHGRRVETLSAEALSASKPLRDSMNSCEPCALPPYGGGRAAVRRHAGLTPRAAAAAAGVYKKSDEMPHVETDPTDPKCAPLRPPPAPTYRWYKTIGSGFESFRG